MSVEHIEIEPVKVGAFDETDKRVGRILKVALVVISHGGLLIVATVAVAFVTGYPQWLSDLLTKFILWTFS